jgi:hypothetical protein
MNVINGYSSRAPARDVKNGEGNAPCMLDTYARTFTNHVLNRLWHRKLWRYHLPSNQDCGRARSPHARRQRQRQREFTSLCHKCQSQRNAQDSIHLHL